MVKDFLKKILSIRAFYLLVKIKNRYFPTQQYLNSKREIENRKIFYADFLKPGDLVFDVGANYGNRVEVFLELKTNVVAIEPNPECIKYLKAIYGSKITLVEKGAGLEEKIMDFYIADSSTLSSFSKEWIDVVKNTRFKDTKWENIVKVPLTTLDRLISQFGTPIFIKIDVEGFEFEVIKGLSHKITYISFEYVIPEKKQTLIDCINLLQTRGKMEVNYSVGESMSLMLKEWCTPAAFLKHIETSVFCETDSGDIYIRYCD